jgi:hypothetical protein
MPRASQIQNNIHDLLELNLMNFLKFKNYAWISLQQEILNILSEN